MSDRFHVFASRVYYPSGGLEDWVDSAATLEEAIALVPPDFLPKSIYQEGHAHIGELRDDGWYLVWSHGNVKSPPVKLESGDAPDQGLNYEAFR